MKLFCRIALALSVLCPGAMAQQTKISVSVSRIGHDQIGSLFVAALNKELSKSTKYKLMRAEEPLPNSAKSSPKISDAPKKGLELYIELATVDVSTSEQNSGNTSAISVVIECMGLPNSWPVPYMWYHKVVLTSRDKLSVTAKQLVTDMDARWCSTLKNSVGGCPKEVWP